MRKSRRKSRRKGGAAAISHRNGSHRHRNGSHRLAPYPSTSEFLPQEFINGMYQNFFQYINLDVLTELYELYTRDTLKTSEIAKIDDDKSLVLHKKYHNTLCFKGDKSAGHYVYVHVHPVDNRVEVFGTYEKYISSGLMNLCDLDGHYVS